SLSDAPGKHYYRITVKIASPPPNRPELKPGKASSFINEGLKEGDQIEIKAPAGHFFLQDDPYRPAVLLAGGIGITPMVSMANTLLENNSKRPIILLYGVRNGLDQPFRHHLEELGSRHDNFFSIFCYSRPCPEDLLDRDYHIEGFVSVDILKKLLPQPACEFYLCGPPKFMDSIYNDLKDWNVGEDQIFFEAFGPATVGKNRNKEKGSHLTEMTHQIRFSQSEVTVKWDGSCDSLLELAEAKEIPIDSGCRAGSCGTCVTKILSGSVSYPDNQAVDCGSDECLACIAQPASDLELEV
ncbi:MAG: 2Fe-2S iron-sulfur cluster-binding protein, partial [Planctomycetota bacterium]